MRRSDILPSWPVPVDLALLGPEDACAVNAAHRRHIMRVPHGACPTRAQSKHGRTQKPGPEKGQALTEFLVLAFALIPLFLLIPIVAKYQDVAHAAQLASRYVAFEATVHNHTGAWKSEPELAGEIRRRFFSNSEAPIKTGDTAGNFPAHRNMFWRGPQGEPLITDFDNDVALSFGRERRPDHAGAFLSGSDRANYQALADRMGLETPGIYRANVSVRLANLPDGLRSYEPFNSINLTIARTSSVLIDPWTAPSPAHTDDRVYSASSLSAHRALAAGADAEVSLIDAPGGMRAPLLGQLDFWHDLVPDDRLR